MFGLQRTGTNYLKGLIYENFHARQVNPGKIHWKHSVKVHDDLPDLPRILIAKHPFTWVESLAHRRKIDWFQTQHTYQTKANRHTPIWRVVGDFDIGGLARTYRDFYTNWLNTGPEYVQYESLLLPNSRRSTLKLLGVVCRFSPKNDQYDAVPETVTMSGKFSYEKWRYYLNCDVSLTGMQKQHIESVIGEDLLKRLGYYEWDKE